MNKELKILAAPTKVKGLHIVNERFPKSWESIQRYNKAIESGFYIEALVLSINVLKYYLTLLVEMYLMQQGTGEKKKHSILKERKDVMELLNYCRQIKIINNKEYQSVEKHWNGRNDTLHQFINGIIDYDKVHSESKRHFEVCYLVFSKAFDTNIGPEEKVGHQIRRKITLSPKTILKSTKK